MYTDEEKLNAQLAQIDELKKQVDLQSTTIVKMIQRSNELKKVVVGLQEYVKKVHELILDEAKKTEPPEGDATD